MFLLGYPPMDDTHREFVEIVSALLGCSDEEFAAQLEAFARHAEAHFAEEVMTGPVPAGRTPGK